MLPITHSEDMMMSQKNTPVFDTAAQLDAAHKLAKHFGLWWASSLREDEIASLVGMTADEIKALCDRAVERDIEDGCDESNWRVDPSPEYRTGAYGLGRTRWAVSPDGSATVYIHRPVGVVLSARWQGERLDLIVSNEPAVHYRHVATIIHALSALTVIPNHLVWGELGNHPALFRRIVEEEREWEAHAAEWAGRATVDPWQWRSSKEVA